MNVNNHPRSTIDLENGQVSSSWTKGAFNARFHVAKDWQLKIFL